jgi:hypothetical protein
LGTLNGEVRPEISASVAVPSPRVRIQVHLVAVDQQSDVLDGANQVVVDVVHRERGRPADLIPAPPLKLVLTHRLDFRIDRFEVGHAAIAESG